MTDKHKKALKLYRELIRWAKTKYPNIIIINRER